MSSGVLPGAPIAARTIDRGPRPSGDGAARTGLASELGVLVHAPTGRDASLIADALGLVGIPVRALSTPAELLDALADAPSGSSLPGVGTVLATDEALGVEWSARLADLLDRQPSWSDLPVLILAQSPSVVGDQRWVGSAHAGTVAERLTARAGVTVLDRPVRMATLVSAVRASLRARSRQLEVRGLIEAHTRAQQEAEQANRAKSDFLAVMSHELRTPLNAIAGYAELLATGCYGAVTPPQGEALARITRAQRHLLGVINDVLNFARLEKGRVEYQIEVVPLHEVVAEVGSLVEPLVNGKGLHYEVCPPSPAIAVFADREKLRQVLLNLITNAAKFTAPGGRIVVDAPARRDGASQPPDRVFLRIRDTGLGIAREKQDQVFEPFVQVRAQGEAREGMGLGLSISRDLARGMGGDLRVRSELGDGSAFTVDLERAPAPAASR